MSAEIQVYRSAIDDFRNLIAFVAIIESAGIEGECAVQQRVLAAEFERVHEFWLENEGMYWVVDRRIGERKRIEHGARRIGPTRFVTMRSGVPPQRKQRQFSLASSDHGKRPLPVTAADAA